MTKVKKIPMRKCVITQERFPKKELVRVVRTPEGQVQIDLTGKMNGHGAYVCAKQEVIEKAMKNKALERALDVKIDASIYEQLLKLC